MAPDFIRVTLPFMQENTITLLAGVGGSRQYRGNSCFDPDFTGIGTDCNLFSQWAAIYAKYRVRGCKLTLRATPQVIPGANTQVGITAYSGTTLIPVTVTLADVIASNFGKGGMCNLYNNTLILSETLESTDVLGTIPLALSIDDGFAAAVTANPVKVWMWQISAFCTTALTVDLSILLQYDVEFFERIQTTA